MANQLTRQRYQMAHHYYISEVVALSQVRDEAQRRAFDKRSPEDSVIHYHDYTDKAPFNCAGMGLHHEYEANKGLLKEEQKS